MANFPEESGFIPQAQASTFVMESHSKTGREFLVFGINCAFLTFSSFPLYGIKNIPLKDICSFFHPSASDILYYYTIFKHFLTSYNPFISSRLGIVFFKFKSRNHYALIILQLLVSKKNNWHYLTLFSKGACKFKILRYWEEFGGVLGNYLMAAK